MYFRGTYWPFNEGSFFGSLNSQSTISADSCIWIFALLIALWTSYDLTWYWLVPRVWRLWIWVTIGVCCWEGLIGESDLKSDGRSGVSTLRIFQIGSNLALLASLWAFIGSNIRYLPASMCHYEENRIISRCSGVKRLLSMFVALKTTSMVRSLTIWTNWCRSSSQAWSCLRMTCCNSRLDISIIPALFEDPEGVNLMVIPSDFSALIYLSSSVGIRLPWPQQFHVECARSAQS